MMGFGPWPWRPLRLCASHVLRIRFLNEVSEGKTNGEIIVEEKHL